MFYRFYVKEQEELKWEALGNNLSRQMDFQRRLAKLVAREPLLLRETSPGINEWTFLLSLQDVELKWDFHLNVRALSLLEI